MTKEQEVVTKVLYDLLFRINGVQKLASAVISPTSTKT
ncbi:hypothetical protein CU026_1645 [Enterococcus faecium]|nr:hypothetical protein [Enterococcus faecium]MBK4766986.1 hypothetical protein [Enterococcus faecium]MBK4811966.1 hypothetical protein [Enterococcus faecium]MBK4814840.1 hypothetical protein [Enterococcus faecium]MBK4823036.1 hypothetical protein [Enterococcus faecium]